MISEAIAQIPASHRGRLLVTSDGAGASHDLIDWLVGQDDVVDFSVGFDVDADVRAAIITLRPESWVPALNNTTGAARDDADVADITALMRTRVERCGWPKDLTFTVRRTRLAPGEAENCTLFHVNGYKYSCFVTAKTDLNVQRRDARHRVHARVEDGVRTSKDTPALQVLGGQHRLVPLAKAEPKTLHFRLLQTAARLTHRQRHRWLRVPRDWPWATALAQSVARIRAIPLPRPG